MHPVLNAIVDWAEFWSTFLALVMFVVKRPQPYWIKPILAFLVISSILFLIIESYQIFYWSMVAKEPVDIEHLQWWASNTVFYSVLSICRFGCICWFFARSKIISQRTVYIVAFLYVIGLLIIEIFTNDSILNRRMINSPLMALESFLTISFCMMYYVKLIDSEDSEWKHLKSFWIVTSLAILFVLNFFVFLFYRPLIETHNRDLSLRVWDIVGYVWILSNALLVYALFAKETDVY